MAGGYPGFFGGKLNAIWLWVPLCIAFIAPFFDPRRPFRLLHLDLLAILSLSVSLAFLNHGPAALSRPLLSPPLLYLLLRAVQVLRHCDRIDRLVPQASPRAMV